MRSATRSSCGRHGRGSSNSSRTFRPEVRGFERLPDARAVPGRRQPLRGSDAAGHPSTAHRVVARAWRGRAGSTRCSTPSFSRFPAWDRSWRGPARSRPGPSAAEAVLRSGAILLDYPGGDHEVFRPGETATASTSAAAWGSSASRCGPRCPWCPRCRSARTRRSSSSPRGERARRLLRLDTLFRVKVMPFVSGRPWAWCPAGSRRSRSRPRSPSSCSRPSTGPPGTDRGGRGRRRGRRACYDEITSAMQTALDRLAAEAPASRSSDERAERKSPWSMDKADTGRSIGP